jgi:hypothetical protein
VAKEIVYDEKATDVGDDFGQTGSIATDLSGDFNPSVSKVHRTTS